MDESCKNPDCDHKPPDTLWSTHGAYGHDCRRPQGAVGDAGAGLWCPRGHTGSMSDIPGPQDGSTGPQGSTGTQEIRELLTRLWHIFE